MKKIILIALFLGSCSPDIWMRQNPERFEFYRGYVLHYSSTGRMTVLTDSDLRILGIDSLTTYHKATKRLREPF